MLSLLIGDSQLSRFQNLSKKVQSDDDGDDETAVEEHNEFVDHTLENEVYCGFYVDPVVQAVVNTN